MKQLKIQTKEDLETALKNSERIQIQNIKNNAYGVICPPQIREDPLSIGCHGIIYWEGFQKTTENFIQKTDWGFYLVQGLTMKFELPSRAIDKETIVSSQFYIDKIKSLKNRKAIDKIMDIFSNMSDAIFRDSADRIMMDQLDNIPFHLRIPVSKEYLSTHPRQFTVSDIRNADSYKSKLFYPTDEVIALYE